MIISLISNVFTCVCAFIGFIYGIIKFFKPKKAIYSQMITLAVGCMAFGRLYQTVRLLTGGSIVNEFQLGVLGVIGSLMFLFSANFGAMDSIADDGSKKLRKYRIIPLSAPIAMIALYLIFICFSSLPMLAKVAGGVVVFFAVQASYYNLKHLIFPDVDFGIINCIKIYNCLALIYSFLCIAEFIAISRESEAGTLIIGVAMGIVLLALVPTLERGMKRCTI